MNTLSYNLRPDTAKFAIRTLRAAVSSIPGASVVDGPLSPLKVQVYATVELAHGRALTPAYSRIVEVVPVTVTLPEGWLETGEGWQVVARRDAGAHGWDATQWYGDHKTDAEARELARLLCPIPPTACTECGKAVRRLVTTVISHPEHGYRQVGGTCEAQYIPATLLKLLSALSKAEAEVIPLQTDELELEGLGCRWADPEWVDLREYLAHCYAWLTAQDAVFCPAWIDNLNGREPNPSATWRGAWDATAILRDDELEPAPDWVFDALEADRDTARYTESRFLHRRDAPRVCAKVHNAIQKSRQSDAPKVEVPEGRQRVTGKILSTKLVESDWGTQTKALVDCGGYRLYGSVPASAKWKTGDSVAFTATVQPRELGFGFFSRPAKPEVVVAA